MNNRPSLAKKPLASAVLAGTLLLGSGINATPGSASTTHRANVASTALTFADGQKVTPAIIDAELKAPIFTSVSQVAASSLLPTVVKEQLTDVPPLSPGQVVPGYPKGPKPSPAGIFHLTSSDISKLKAGHYTAAIVMAESSEWTTLQEMGMKDTFKKLGIRVVSTTEADFSATTQNNNLATVESLHPSVILSLPVNGQTEAKAYQNAAKSGIKMVFLDNVPPGFTSGKNYVDVVTANDYGDGAFAGAQLAEASGCSGQVGALTIGYYFYVVTIRDNGALAKLKACHGLNLVQQSFSDPGTQAANEASDMLLGHSSMKGVFAAWEQVAWGVVAAERSQNRKVVVTTTEISPETALDIAQGYIAASGSQQPYLQGVAEAQSAAYSFLGKKVPPFIELPTVAITPVDLIPAYEIVTHQRPGANVIAALRASTKS